MKKVYFVQVSLNYGKSMYLPYSIACLAAYAWQFAEISVRYENAGYLICRENPKQALEKIVDPDLVAFSCSVWSMEYNKVLAALVKDRYPQCRIVFGGHSVAPHLGLLEQYPFIDYLLFGEGEEPFRALLCSLADSTEPRNIPGVSGRDPHGNIFHTPQATELSDLNTFPSPYLTGQFDALIRENPNTEFCAVVETNRGCPFHCAYCDWCYTTRVRFFPLERFEEEIRWCCAHRVEYVFCADSNFGMFPRDLEIAQFVVGLRQKTGYPHVFNVCFAKNSNDTVFAISKLFYDNKINKATTLAYQSVCDTALENIHRKNFSPEVFSRLMQKYNAYGIPSYTELILGLPGETYDTFTHGLCSLLEANQHSCLTVYYCQVYPNALMGSAEYQTRFGIRTAHKPINYLHTTLPDQTDEIKEYYDIVISTRDMPFEDLAKCIVFCALVQCFHHLGLLKCFALYIHDTQHVSYFDFYSALQSYVFSAKGTFLCDLFEKLRKKSMRYQDDDWDYYRSEQFGDIGWHPEEGVYMELVSRFDRFWAEILPFLRSFSIEPDVFDELLHYQKFIILLPGMTEVQADFDYDFYNFFYRSMAGNPIPLRRIQNHIRVTIPEPVQDWIGFGQIMLSAKKRGSTILTSDHRNLQIRYADEQ